MPLLKKTILVIEDESALRGALKDALTANNFAVIEAASGEEGLSLALAKHPNLILLDIVMPGMDGIEMLKKLREDSWGKDAKAILLTNYSDNKHIGNAVENGVYEYLVKTDWKISDLIKKVDERLNEA